MTDLRLLFVLLLGIVACAAAAQPLDADASQQRLRVLADPAALFDIIDLSGRPPPNSTVPPSLGRGEPVRVWWGWLDLDGLDTSQPLVLRPGRFWQGVEAFAADGSQLARTGSGLRRDQRSLPSDHLALPLPAHVHGPVLLRFEGTFDGYLFPIRFLDAVETRADFDSWLRRVELLNGVYAGLILALALFHLFLGFAVRDRVYFWYVLYAGTFGMIWVARAGIGFELLWPNALWWNTHSSFMLIGAAVLSGNRFVQVFLDLKRNVPAAHLALHGASAIVLVAAILGAIGRWSAASNTMALAALLASIVYLPAGVLALRRGYKPARFYLIACSALILGIIAYVLTYFGLLPRVFVTVYGAQIGSALEMLLLAFALGDRINLLRREKLEIEMRSREQLEREVDARTAELAAEKSRVELAREEAESANRRLRQANLQLEELSHVDSLTGVANRRRFEQVLDAEWRRMERLGEPLSVILLDVDHFKEFNDAHGHLAGDACLQRIAAALTRCMHRSGDLLARFGGEEFAVVLPQGDLPTAVALAERMRVEVATMAMRVEQVREPIAITIGAGVCAALPVPGADSTDLVRHADLALYAAKRRGRNRVEIHDAGRTAAQRL
ncbi:MAG TPA: diguanylate cyclase [Xanthomonadaceae bacterium]|nr:diguanylate cyclase [Xanthomonadaceae bacterium]